MGEADTLRKERSWLGPLVVGLLVQMLIAGVGWFTELRTHGLAIDSLQKQVGALQSGATELKGSIDALKTDKSGPEMARDIAVIKERVQWLVNGFEDLRKKRR